MKIVEILSEVLGDSINVPCHNTVENWMKKLGLSVYQDDKPCKSEKYAMVMDESIAINGQKLLLALAIPSDHQGRPTRHEDVTILEMSVASKFNGEDIKEKVQSAADNAGANPQFVISDNGHNLVRGITDSGFIRHADISHSLGVVLKNVYGKDADFVNLTSILGTKRLQYHLTDKAYLLPPNMRAIARFMNMSSWVTWGNQMLDCLDSLSDEMQDAYSFLKRL